MKRVAQFVEGFAAGVHARTDVDGFAHNCIGHPLLWVAIKLERFA